MAATADRLLDLAHDLVQERGMSAVSFRDLASPLGITHAAVHYHFGSKHDLARALVARYRRDLLAALPDVDGESAADGLRQFLAHYRAGAAEGRLCLCAMMASDATLAAEVQTEVRRFFDEVEVWLVDALDDGRRAGTVAFNGASGAQAAAFLGTVEGAMLTARPYFALGSDVAAARFDSVVAPMRARLFPTTP